MKLNELMNQLQNIVVADKHDARNIVVGVARWEDGMYEAEPLEGIRIVQDIWNNEETMRVYLIRGEGANGDA